MIVVDFNQQPLLVKREELPMATVDDIIHVVDPDGELEADAVVIGTGPDVVLLYPITDTIRDRPWSQSPAT